MHGINCNLLVNTGPGDASGYGGGPYKTPLVAVRKIKEGEE